MEWELPGRRCGGEPMIAGDGDGLTEVSLAGLKVGDRWDCETSLQEKSSLSEVCFSFFPTMG